MDQNGQMFIGLVAICFAKVLALAFLSRRHRKEWCEVGKLQELKIFPVKSFKGIDLMEADCGYGGLHVTNSRGKILKDRTFILITSTSEMVTARQKPTLLNISCSIPSHDDDDDDDDNNGHDNDHDDDVHDNDHDDEDDALVLNAPGMEELVIKWMKEDSSVQTKTCVWGDSIEGVDCGDEASDWINRYLATSGYRLLRHTDKSSRRKLSSQVGKWYEHAKEVDEVTYQDGFPFLMVTSSSMDEVKLMMTNKYKNNDLPVNQHFFRANFFIITDSPPFSEDHWSEIRIGECNFFNIQPCTRCVLTTIDPESGRRRQDMEPLKTLRSFRLLYPEFGQSPCFGVNMTLIRSGKVKVGDKVYVKRWSSLTDDLKT